jgi:hypothetical protein
MTAPVAWDKEVPDAQPLYAENDLRSASQPGREDEIATLRSQLEGEYHEDQGRNDARLRGLLG